MLLHLLHPCRRRSNGVKVEVGLAYQLLYIYITVVAFYYLCLRLKRTQYLLRPLQFALCNLRSLVQKNDIAEFYLLNHKILYIILRDVLLQEILSAFKLVAQTQRIHHADNTVQPCNAVAHIFRPHLRHSAYSLCYWHRLAYSRRLDDDIVKLLHLHQVLQLLHQIHLKRTAYTSVL